MAKLLTGTRIYGTGTVDTQLFVNGTEQAVSTTTGALEVIGGAGIGGNLHLGGISVSAGVQSTNVVASGTLGVTGTTTLTVLNATSATFSGTLGVTGTSVLAGLQASNIVASGTLGVTGTSTLAGITLVTNTTSATSITTGALVVSGGVGIGQDLRVGGVIYGTFNGAVTGTATNAINISGGTVGQVPYQTAPGTTSFYGPGTAGNVLVSNGAAAPSYNNTLTLAGTAAATNATSGALQIAGGVGINDNLFVTNNINAVSGQFVSTRANNATTGAGQIYLNGATGNRIDWNQNGVAAPAFTTRSAGAKLVLYPNISASAADYAFGIESGFLWSGVADTTNGFKWYGGTTLAATLSGTGNLTLVGDLAVNGGDITTTQATFNLINTTATTVNFAGAATSLNVGATSGSTNVRNNLIISGNLTVQGTTTIVDSTVTNIADPIITLGGGSGNNNPTTDDNKDRGVAFKWVNNGGTTSTGFFGYDDSTGHLTYIQTATITNEVVSGTKGAVDANLAGGTAMSIVYQSAANTTEFLAAGSSGFILQTNGTSAAPTWVSSAGIGAGSATNSDAIRTIERTTNASHFLTFVDSNNATNAYESLYTTSSFVINPQSRNVGIGVTSPSTRLDIADAARSGSTNVSGTVLYATGDVNDTQFIAQFRHLNQSQGIGFSYNSIRQTGSNTNENISLSSRGTGNLFLRYDSTDSTLGTVGLTLLGTNGNVGIGTTPATKLDVAGTIGFTVGSAAGIIRRTTVNGSNGIRIQGNASDTINTDAAAGAYITVGGGVIGDTFEGNIDIVAYGGNVDANRNQIRFSNRSGVNTITERMRIDKDGNVGIGTASPAYRLTVTTSTNSATTTASTIALHLFNSASDGNISQPGRVGIGFGASTTRSAIVAGTYGNDYLDFYTSGDITTPRIRIRSTGAIAFSGTNTHGSNGFVLKSNGDAAPTWADPSTLASGSATNADAIRTVARTTNASHFLTFVDSNNASNAYEPLYTTSSFTINPQSGFLTVANTARIGATVAQGDPSTTDITANATLLLSGVGGNYLAFGQKASNLAQWIQSSYSTPTTAVYPISLNPLGGNVGIGTISPTAKLQVELSGTVSLAAATIVKSTDFGADSRAGFPGLANNSDGIYFGMGANGTGIPAGFGFFREASGWNTALAFYTNNVTSGPNSTAAMQEKMRITSGGGIAFGGASNYGSSGQILQSNGDAAPTWVALSGRTVGTSTQVTTVAQTASASYFPTFVDSNNASATAESVYTTSSFTINAQSGNVGIGISGSSSKLSVLGANSSSLPLLDLTASGTGTYQRGVRLLNSGMNVGDHIMMAVGTADNSRNMGQFYFYNAGAGSTSNRLSMGLHSVDDVFNIVGTSYVGIGTTAPVNKFEVKGTFGGPLTSGSSQNGIVRFSQTAGGGSLDIGFGDPYSWIQSRQSSDYSTNYRIALNPNGGNVCIGTTSTTNKFEVAGTAGQLFSISDSFTGTIFSANDVSGIPSIEVLDTGLVKLAQYNGSVAISTGTAVSGSALSVYGIISTIGTTGEIRASSEITAYYSSDARLKENIKLIENPITILDQIRGVTFDWTDEHMARRGGEDGYFVRKHDIGVIAQEVQAVLPELVGTREDGYLAVKYEKMVALLIEAIKEQQKSIDMLKIELEKIKKQ